jgi:hypothetical protein
MESLNGKLRDECLNEQVFSSLAEARRIIECWRIDYNTARPHSSLDYQTPEEFAANWHAAVDHKTMPDAAPAPATGRAAAVCGASASRPVAQPPCEGQNENRLNLMTGGKSGSRSGRLHKSCLREGSRPRCRWSVRQPAPSRIA